MYIFAANFQFKGHPEGPRPPLKPSLIMAKGNMLLGRATGSIGDLTFSVSNGKQVIKAKPATVKNRQTKAQMIQRILMNTVAQAYSKMSEIVDHSFEGVNYGADSMAYFMKQNLKALRRLAVDNGLDQQGAPNVVPLGSSYLATNDYIISKGTLPEILFKESTEYKAFSLGAANTYESVISQLGAQRGDQLTLLTISGTNVADLRFSFCRIILSPIETDGTEAPLSTEFVDASGDIVKPNPRNENYGIELEVDGTDLTIFSEGAGYTACRAAILSRQGEDGNWKRSNAHFVQGPDMQVGYTIQEAYDDFVSGGLDVVSSRYLNNAVRGKLAGNEGGGSSPEPTPTPSDPDTLKLNGGNATIGGSAQVTANSENTLLLYLGAQSVRIGLGVKVGAGAIQTLTAGNNSISVTAPASEGSVAVKIGSINGTSLDNESTLFTLTVAGGDDY